VLLVSSSLYPIWKDISYSPCTFHTEDVLCHVVSKLGFTEVLLTTLFPMYVWITYTNPGMFKHFRYLIWCIQFSKIINVYKCIETVLLSNVIKVKLLLKCRISLSSLYILLEQFNVIYRYDTEDTKSWYMDLIIWEEIGIVLQPNDMNREDSLILSKSWKLSFIP
jgi:hypothetical protein